MLISDVTGPSRKSGRTTGAPGDLEASYKAAIWASPPKSQKDRWAGTFRAGALPLASSGVPFSRLPRESTQRNSPLRARFPPAECRRTRLNVVGAPRPQGFGSVQTSGHKHSRFGDLSASDECTSGRRFFNSGSRAAHVSVRRTTVASTQRVSRVGLMGLLMVSKQLCSFSSFVQEQTIVT